MLGGVSAIVNRMDDGELRSRLEPVVPKMPSARPAVQRTGLMRVFADPASSGVRMMTARESRDFLRRLFAEEAMTPSTRRVYLKWLAWRIARELAMRQSLLAYDDGLSSLGAPGIDSVWYNPAAAIACTCPAVAAGKPMSEWSNAGVLLYGGGTPLVPTDTHLPRYVEVVRRLASERRLVRGTEVAPGAWSFAVDALEDDNIVRDWPTPEEVLDFEEAALEHIYKAFVSTSTSEAVDEARALLGVSRFEGGGLVQAAVTQATRVGRLDVEQKRQVMEARLEDVANRAREACDLDQELRALKQLGMVQGLTRTEPVTLVDEIMSSIKSVAATDVQTKPRLRITATVDDEPQAETA